MKARTCIFIFLIASLAALGWRDHRKLRDLRQDRDRLTARAVKLGMPSAGTNPTKRPRPDAASEARLAAAEFIKHHKEHEAVKRAGGDPDKSPESAAANDRMAMLDSSQMRMVIAEILGDPELGEKERRKLISKAVWFLVRDDSAGALSLFSEFSAHLKDTGLGRQIVRQSLGALAKENPHAAIAWARNHADGFPEIIKSAQSALISNAALQDPALAFEIIREFGTQRNPGDTESSILNTSKPEIRTMAFAAFRQHLACMEDETLRRAVEQRAWTGLAEGIAGEGFESGRKWLAAANPTPAELSSILQRVGIGLANSRKVDEAGLWVEWTAEALPAAEWKNSIPDMIQYWAMRDFQAAGQWINSRPDGPIKLVSISAYAEALAGSQPGSAAEWAMTLPPGKDREDTFKNIHRRWPKEDPAGAAAFATEHGIK